MRQAVTLSLVLLGLVAASASASPLPTTLDGCVRTGPTVQVVKLAASHDDEIETAILGHGSAGVVLANQSDRDLCSWLPFARVLERAGYRVLVFDYGAAEPWIEIAAAAETLHRLGVARVSLIGASEGAKASIVAAARDTTPVQAVASISAERYFRDGTDVKRWAARLARPILFVMAKNDPFAAADTPTLYRACSAPVKKLVTVAGDAHGIDLLSGANGDLVRRDILSFLRRQR
jgi:pimeloyl-ACP methyl ester carboxylesterase